MVLGCLVHNDVGVGVLLPLFWTGTRQSLTPEGRPRSPPSTGLGPGWATGGWRGGQGHCSAAPGGHPQKAALLPRPGRPLGLGTAHRPGVRRGGGADLPSAGCLASPHPANCQLTPRPPWGPLPSGLAPCPKAPRAGEPGLGQSWGADAWRSAPWDRVAAGSRAVLTPTPVSPKHRRGGLAPSRVPFPRGGRSAARGVGAGASPGCPGPTRTSPGGGPEQPWGGGTLPPQTSLTEQVLGAHLGHATSPAQAATAGSGW